jgi:hypothetical protein
MRRRATERAPSSRDAHPQTSMNDGLWPDACAVFNSRRLHCYSCKRSIRFIFCRPGLPGVLAGDCGMNRPLLVWLVARTQVAHVLGAPSPGGRSTGGRGSLERLRPPGFRLGGWDHGTAVVALPARSGAGLVASYPCSKRRNWRRASAERRAWLLPTSCIIGLPSSPRAALPHADRILKDKRRVSSAVGRLSRTSRRVAGPHARPVATRPSLATTSAVGSVVAPTRPAIASPNAHP